MARAYKCDRCGAFYESNKDAKITTRRYDWGNAQKEHDDLCEEWFDAGKEVREDVLDK